VKSGLRKSYNDNQPALEVKAVCLCPRIVTQVKFRMRGVPRLGDLWLLLVAICRRNSIELNLARFRPENHDDAKSRVFPRSAWEGIQTLKAKFGEQREHDEVKGQTERPEE
jgi:hypothetical protein